VVTRLILLGRTWEVASDELPAGERRCTIACPAADAHILHNQLTKAENDVPIRDTEGRYWEVISLAIDLKSRSREGQCVFALVLEEAPDDVCRDPSQPEEPEDLDWLPGPPATPAGKNNAQSCRKKKSVRRPHPRNGPRCCAKERPSWGP
jgi:hypothetical protein